MYHSTLGLRVMKQKKKKHPAWRNTINVPGMHSLRKYCISAEYGTSITARPRLWEHHCNARVICVHDVEGGPAHSWTPQTPTLKPSSNNMSMFFRGIHLKAMARIWA